MSEHSGIPFCKVLRSLRQQNPTMSFAHVNPQLAALEHPPSSVLVSDFPQTPSWIPLCPFSRSAIFLQDERPSYKTARKGARGLLPPEDKFLTRTEVRDKENLVGKFTYHERIPWSGNPYPKIHLAQLSQGVIPSANLLHIRRIVLCQLLIQI